MIKIFETAKIKILDQYTIDHEPIASIDLVERAATAFTNEFCRQYPIQSRVLVFAGQGNNGADALAIARLLHDENFQKVEVYLINPTQRLSPDCEQNKLRLLSDNKIPLYESIDEFEIPEISDRDIVIDGLFGSGLNRPLNEGFVALIDYINQSGATIVSIDIPSGLYGEDNRGNDPRGIIRANLTYTFEAPKLSFVLPENAPYIGKWKIVPIGIHPYILEETETPYLMVTDEDMEEVIHKRNRFAHKGHFGHALLVAGSKGKMGAAVLAAGSCLRSGAGRLTVHLPQRGETVLQTALPEAMLSLDAHTDYVSNLPEIKDYEAIGIGPGLGATDESMAVLENLLDTAVQPLLLDADALNLLALNKDLIAKLPEQTILTPHPKEFDNLFGNSVSGYERLHKAVDMAVQHKLCIVLKGGYSATCTPEGNIFINSTGNPGMATAGSGDVLTGIILALLAQGYPAVVSAVTGVYLHGLAGDRAAANSSEESMIASDITRMLGKAFQMLQKDV
ncbi:MAG: NAD(P)H-hydrate dehydratase [Tannerella sp.]|nr:NAD(P)H-hydrate dehydratase [Tannerella sp.]